MQTEWSNFLEWTLANEPGSVSEQTLQLENGVTIEVWDSGVMAVTPAAAEAAKDIVISCAIHGDETAPIELVRDMIADIIAQTLVPAHRVLFLIGNPWAIKQGTRFVHENMNRLFSGAHLKGDTMEHQRAERLEFYVQRFYEANPNAQPERLHYDLHTAIRDSKFEKFAVYPFTHGKPYKKKELAFLAKAGVHTILLNRAPTTTFSYFSVKRFGADAFTVELGKVRPFGQNDMARFADSDQALRELISERELQLPDFDPDAHQIFDVAQTIDRTCEQFTLHFADDEANFTPFERGYVIATDGEREIKIEQPQAHIIFPNAKVKIGQRALLLVVQIPTTELELV